MTRYFYLFALVFSSVFTSVAAPTHADSLYNVQNYKDAISAYEAQLTDGINAEIYYNLGNCYYRMDDVPQAILNYLKTLKIEPQHEQAQDNLQLCLEKVNTNIAEGDEMFYTTMLKSLVRSKNANDWGMLATIAWGLVIAFAIGYLLVRKPAYKKMTFFAALVALLCVVILNIFAYQSKQDLFNVDNIVALRATPIYESATTAAKQIGEVPAGTILRFNEDFQNEWFNVTLPDGREAWCERQFIEKVELTPSERALHAD